MLLAICLANDHQYVCLQVTTVYRLDYIGCNMLYSPNTFTSLTGSVIFKNFTTLNAALCGAFCVVFAHREINPGGANERCFIQ